MILARAEVTGSGSTSNVLSRLCFSSATISKNRRSLATVALALAFTWLELGDLEALRALEARQFGHFGLGHHVVPVEMAINHLGLVHVGHNDQAQITACGWVKDLHAILLERPPRAALLALVHKFHLGQPFFRFLSTGFLIHFRFEGPAESIGNPLLQEHPVQAAIDVADVGVSVRNPIHEGALDALHLGTDDETQSGLHAIVEARYFQVAPGSWHFWAMLNMGAPGSSLPAPAEPTGQRLSSLFLSVNCEIHRAKSMIRQLCSSVHVSGSGSVATPTATTTSTTHHAKRMMFDSNFPATRSNASQSRTGCVPRHDGLPQRSLRRSLFTSWTMSHSKYEYVRQFESDDRCLKNCWLVVRIDGKAFHKFSESHQFQKPNDQPALDLMTKCAESVLEQYKDILVAYGQSDEYSFVFRKNTDLYNRRSSKIMTNVVSAFASSYVFHWKDCFPSRPLTYPPTFDARTVLYPTNRNLRDYLSWRQVDCHINNLYNTTFWNLVLKGGMTNREAQERLKGTESRHKHEILFSQFGINYNNESEQFKKGTTVYRKSVDIPMEGGGSKVRTKTLVTFTDIIGDTFWEENAHILDEFKDS
eukprot:maker-scaffold898_size83862-snap-gene-0.14 protein:Tk12462 transcript:maker-scaffold898_size83862-snap-gene-0.14-mRNA-1 annotation:"hypothetical protein DAPPUDRAFT_39947"